MRNRLLQLLVLGLLLALVLIKTEVGFEPRISQEMAMIVDEVIKKDNIPGAVVGVWQGKKAWVYAVGLSDINRKTRMQRFDKFRIASNTKTFTALVVLQLAEEGKLSLDDALNEFIPEIPNSDRITIRQLLNHTSGIYDFTEDKDFQKAYHSNPLKKWTPQKEIKIVLEHAPDFKPGAKWKYSNTNYILLGMIIEKVTGEKIEDEIERRILRPLKLYRTSFPVIPDMKGRYSHGYMVDDQGNLKDITMVNPSIPWAAGAMISDVYDMRKWVEALARGDLISPAMKIQQQAWIPTGINNLEFGLGVMKLGDFIGHNGKILGFGSFMLYFPEKDTTIVLFVNKCNEDEKTQSMTEIIKGIEKVLFGS